MELHHPIMSKLWDLGGRTQRKKDILQNEDGFYKWAYVKIDPVKNEVKTENVKTEENVNTKLDSNKEEYVQKTINRVSFAKQEN